MDIGAQVSHICESSSLETSDTLSKLLQLNTVVICLRTCTILPRKPPTGQVGDTALPLAVASRGGTVVAIEMGPPIHMLRINQR